MIEHDDLAIARKLTVAAQKATDAGLQYGTPVKNFAKQRSVDCAVEPDEDAVARQLFAAVQKAADAGLTPQRIATVVRAAVEGNGLVPGGLWSMWLEKASATSGQARP